MSPHHMFVTCRTSHCGHCIKRKENHLAEIWLDQFIKREVGFGPVGQWAWRQGKERQCLQSRGPQNGPKQHQNGPFDPKWALNEEPS